ncbi:HD-GYP domain-containing protein [Nitrospira sp. Nam74]
MKDLNQGVMMKQATTALTAFEAALDSRDSATYAHCQRTASMAVVLGRRLGLSEEQLLTLERGVFLHDIGKIHVPERILKKSGLLEEADWKIMRGHAVTGYAMLSSNPALTEVAAIVLAHHERYDGTGYPHRLEGDDIPFGARICAVADCFDMLIAADHSYRRAMSVSEAWAYIRSQQGRHFDPVVVEAFLSITPAQWRHIHAASSEPQLRRVDWSMVRQPSLDSFNASPFDNISSKVVACCGAS